MELRLLKQCFQNGPKHLQAEQPTEMLHFLNTNGIQSFETAFYLKSNHIAFLDFFGQAVDMYKIFFLGIKFFNKTKAF